ncbi:MAG TPA: hypothetical protein PKA60_01400 [Candidatus Paceibacterota bacterium]|nr:hypothetical protein [Candidatus Paceibacterota bacterium]
MEKIINEIAGKQERYSIRNEIESLIFDLGCISKTSVGFNVRKGEVQSAEFIAAAKTVLEDDRIWSSIPEEGEILIELHGVKHLRKYNKDDMRQKLIELVEKHEKLV